MNPSRSILAALVAATILAAPVVAQEPTSDPAAVAAEQARDAAEAAAGPRFQPKDGDYAGCVNEPPESERIQATVPPGFVPQPGMNGGPGWQVSSPRAPVAPGTSHRLTLRDKFGTTMRWVYADVYAPDGSSSRAGGVLDGAQQTFVSYPVEFRAAPPVAPGAYTVVWRDALTDRFLSCDGFVVAS